MKLIILLFGISVNMALAASSYGQNTMLTIKMNEKTMSEVLDAIEEQSGFHFFYNSKLINMNRRVSVNVTNKSVFTVLDQFFHNSNVKYRIIGKDIILTVDEAEGNILQDGKRITGTVVDQAGEPIIGANIMEKGVSNGTITDMDGNFSLDVQSGATLQVSYIGYTAQEITVGNQTTLNIVLREDAFGLEEVVVTALGIVKKEKSLTYSTQIVGGEELTRAKDVNMINSLTGKTAGVQIAKSSSGLGGSVKVVIRGSRSVTGSNQPLYVIDGVPINTSSDDRSFTTIGGADGSGGGNRDGGDGISNLNPDDIESMNILKGPAAAALYGSSAANGVVVITTKKGKAGRTEIAFNSNTTWENAAYGIPELQNHYGGVTTSWGDKISPVNTDYTRDFFRSGMTTINSLSFTTGSDLMQTYLSYANTTGTGIIENNSLNKHNLNVRETANFFNKKLTVDANINMLYQTGKNRPTTGGYYLNPLVGLYHFPIGGPGGEHTIGWYNENYAVLDPGRNIMTQNWYPGGLGTMEQSPYWLTRKTSGVDTRSRTIANLAFTFKFNNYLNLQARGNADFISDKFEKRLSPEGHNWWGDVNGTYMQSEGEELDLYGDLLLTYQKTFGEFALNATLGASMADYTSNKSRVSSGGTGGMYYPNIFIMQNINFKAGGGAVQEIGHKQEQSVFFAGQVGFRDQVYLDMTARNDWTSTLAYTNAEKSGFFYPSVGLTWLLNETLKLPEWITLGKVRAAWSQVGNGLPMFLSHSMNSIGSGGTLMFNSTKPFAELKPEITTSIETGTEWRLFGSRLELDFTYYKTNTRNQLFTLAAPAGAKYSKFYVNAGNIENSGIEVVVNTTPVLTEDFRWKTGLNYSMNRNKVIELVDGLGYFEFGQMTSNSYLMRFEVGGSFGDFYGYKFKRDESGRILYNDAGLPIGDKSEFVKIGNTAPKFNLGWQNTITYKDFTLYFLLDGRFGGDVVSLTQADLDRQGTSKITGVARDRGYVDFDGKQIKDVEGFYTLVGGRDGITEHYVYDATNIRLRELSIGYTLPKKLFKENSLVKGVDVSLIGRNLFFIMNNAPYDTDALLSTGNDLQGVDTFGMPTTRSFGVNIKANF